LTSQDGNLFQQQEANRRRTRWLVIGFILFFAWLGFGADLILYIATQAAEPGDYRHVVPWFGIAVTVVVGIAALYAYKTGPQKVLWAAGAREITTPQTDPERQLVNVVEEMAIAAGVPKPRVWIIPDDDPNAFATGLEPQNSHVTVTHGLLSVCNRDELQGVIGHELGHIKNLDVRLMTTLAALVGAILLMRDGMGRILRHGRVPGLGGGGRSKGKSDLGPLIAILVTLWIISWILAPFITQVLAIAVNRKREFLADAMSAQFTRNPLALAGALEKIEAAGGGAPTAAIKRGSAHLCIVDPLGRRLTNSQGWLADRLATHPPLSMRISRLKGMGYAALKQASTTNDSAVRS
jgi:heat shock protein HtpX